MSELDDMMAASVATSVESAERLLKESEIRVLGARDVEELGILTLLLVRASAELARLRTKEVE